MFCCDGCANVGYSPFEYASIQIALGAPFDVPKYVDWLRKRDDFEERWLEGWTSSLRTHVSDHSADLPILGLPDGTPIVVHDIMPMDIVTKFRVVAPLSLKTDETSQGASTVAGWFSYRRKETMFEKIFRCIEPVSIECGRGVRHIPALAGLPRMSDLLSKTVPRLTHNMWKRVQKIELATLHSGISYVPWGNSEHSRVAMNPSATHGNPWRVHSDADTDVDDSVEAAYHHRRFADLDCLTPAVGSKLYHGTVDTPQANDWIAQLLSNDPSAFSRGLWLTDSKTHELYGGPGREWLYVVGFSLDDEFHPVTMLYRPPGISLQFSVVREIPLVDMDNTHNVLRIFVNSEFDLRKRYGYLSAFMNRSDLRAIHWDEWDDEKLESLQAKRKSNYDTDSSALKLLSGWRDFPGFIHMKQSSADHHNELYIRDPRGRIVLEKIRRSPRTLTPLISAMMKSGVPMLGKTSWLQDAIQKAARFIRSGDYDIIYDDVDDGASGDLRNMLRSGAGKPESIQY